MKLKVLTLGQSFCVYFVREIESLVTQLLELQLGNLEEGENLINGSQANLLQLLGSIDVATAARLFLVGGSALLNGALAVDRHKLVLGFVERVYVKV